MGVCESVYLRKTEKESKREKKREIEREREKMRVSMCVIAWHDKYIIISPKFVQFKADVSLDDFLSLSQLQLISNF